MGWIIGMGICLVVSIAAGIGVSTGGGRGENRSGLGFGVFLVLLVVGGVVISICCSVTIVQPGEAAVQMAFGSFTGDPLPNGTHMIAPWATVVKYTTKIQEYTMDHTLQEGQVQRDDSIAVLCKDRLQMNIDATCFWTVDVHKLNWIHENLGPNYVHQFLRPLIRKVIPEVFGEFDAMEVSTSGREAACDAAMKRLSPEFESMGMKLMEVNLRHIQPPQEVLDAIAAKLAAVEKAKQMESEGEGLVAKARGEAEANRLRQASLTGLLVEWEQIQAWRELAKSQNAKVIVPAGKDIDLLLQP